MKIFLSALIISLIVITGCGKKVKEKSGVSAAATTVTADTYLDLVNAHRLKLNLYTLDIAPIINEQALEHSQAMASKRRGFGHYGRSLRCKKIRDEFGTGNQCGEIIAMGPKDFNEAFKLWISSDSHRQMIEASHFTHTGFAYDVDSNGVKYWTQIFYAVP